MNSIHTTLLSIAIGLLLGLNFQLKQHRDATEK